MTPRDTPEPYEGDQDELDIPDQDPDALVRSDDEVTDPSLGADSDDTEASE